MSGIAVDLTAPPGPGRVPPGRGRRARAAAFASGSAPLLVIALAVSMHLGSAIATGLFGRVGPLGVLWLRCALAALLLLAIFRGRALALPRASRTGVVALGVVLAAMNACFFESIARVPLGVASTIEFTGPLLVAVVGSRRPRDVAFALLAGIGVALLGSPSAHVDALGAVLAFGSAACWATYILLAKRLIAGAEPLPVLTMTLAVAAVVLTGPALATAGPSLWDGHVLAVGLAVAALASAIPYLLELVALRLVSAATFSILLSLEPAIAALIGLLVLGQALGAIEVAAMGCVVLASAAAARAA
ncbi:MAG: inner rane transporter RhtA [Solirubrobacteraceae bacterium]|nr:inner rane transporter RhtA [Solirubrobacteraceae bacterium]